MAAVDIDEPKITYAHETPVKNPSQSEMSNFAGYPHLQRSEADVEEDLGERAQLRLDVEHSPFASYGAAGLLAPLPPSGHRKKAKRRRKRDKATTGSLASFSDEVLSAAGYAKLVEAEEDDEDEDDEDGGPPTIEMIYRRSCKDKTKLIVLPLLYFLTMVVAGLFAFYSIEALVLSYRHRVRTVDYVTVPNGVYEPIGIAMFPQDFSHFINCSFIYSDDLYPRRNQFTPIEPAGQICMHINVTFYSQLVRDNRTAMVFRGPTLASLKQSLGIHFSIDTTRRQFSAIEYLLISDWNDVANATEEKRASFLSDQEKAQPLHTVPGGFRTWVKMGKVVRKDGGREKNLSDFTITADFSKYNDWRNVSDRITDVVYVLFEWESMTYEFIGDILSTNIWNTLGGLAGVFVTLFRVGELFKRWIWRLRRERKKKQLRLQELAEEQQRLMDDYEESKKLRRKKFEAGDESHA